MNNLLLRQRAGLGAYYGAGLGAPPYNMTTNLPPGYTKGYGGEVYDPNGVLAFGGEAKYLQRPLSVDAIAAANTPQTYTLPNGQRATMTPAEYQQLMQSLGAGNPNALASGSITAQGINIGGTTLSWPVLFAAGLALYLLQRPGYEKRR